MWRRKKILQLIAIVGVVFVGLQMAVFYFLIGSRSHSPSQTDNKHLKYTAMKDPLNADETRQTSEATSLNLLDLMKTFMALNHKHEIYSHFIPPRRYSAHKGGHLPDTPCTMFCNTSYLPFTFFLIWHPEHVNPALFYRQHGFDVYEERGHLPEKPQTSVTTHILLSHRNMSIHSTNRVTTHKPMSHRNRDMLELRDTNHDTLELLSNRNLGIQGSMGTFVHLVLLYTFMDENYKWFGKLSGFGKDNMYNVYWSTPGVIPSYETETTKIDGIHTTVLANPPKLHTSLSVSHYIGCNHTRATLFHSLHHEAATQDVYQFIARARDIIRRATDVFRRLEVPYWLSSGTCLGWFRQCSVIPYSIDVDFGVRIRDYDERIVPTFQSAGFKLKMIFGRRNDSYELSFYSDGIKVDIFFFYEETDYMWNGGTQHDDGTKYKYKFPTFHICWSSLLGLAIRVPCPTLPYIRANYGHHWLTPVTEWGWASSPNNVVQNGRWRDEEMEEVIQIFDVETKDDFVIDLHKQH